MMPHLAEMQIHPLKSGQASTVSQAALVATGLENDRRWLVVKPDGTFVNQGGDNPARNHRLARISVTLEDRHVAFHGVRNEQPLRREIANLVNCQHMNVTIYDDACLGVDLGDQAAEWISRELGESVRLLQLPNDVYRLAKYDPKGVETSIGFQDAGTLLIASLPSLEDLNARIAQAGKEGPVTPDRIRANLWIDGCEPYEEDTWEEIEVDGIRIHLTIPCRRCAITTQDQSTGISLGREPLRTLSTYRRWQRPGGTSGPKPIFGMNANHEMTGILRNGSEITVIKRRDEPFVRHALAL